MDAGIAQENLAAQNITLEINPGEVFVAAQGLLHYNHNRQCVPNVFLQSFNSADPGALNVVGALAALAGAGDAGAAAAAASGTAGIMASPQGTFALDQQCLRECGFPETGAPNGGLDDLPAEFKALFGLY
jgi:Cupin